MKKAYIKPVITFEDFAFSSNVAGECGGLVGLHGDGCDMHANYSSGETCAFYDNGIALFTKNQECVAHPDGDYLGNLCYHVNTAANRVFKS